MITSSPDTGPYAYKRAWDAYVDFSMEPGKSTFDCIKATVDAALSGPVAWRSRLKGSEYWQVHTSDPADAIAKYATAGLDGYDIEQLYALGPVENVGQTNAKPDNASQITQEWVDEYVKARDELAALKQGQASVLPCDVVINANAFMRDTITLLKGNKLSTLIRQLESLGMAAAEVKHDR